MKRFFAMAICISLAFIMSSCGESEEKIANTKGMNLEEYDAIRIVDSQDFNPYDRKGLIYIERVFGVVEDAETGDGRIFNAPQDDEFNYISYNDVEGIKAGDIIMSYFVYNPENNYCDDIVDRFDYVIDKDLFEEGYYGI